LKETHLPAGKTAPRATAIYREVVKKGTFGRKKEENFATPVISYLIDY